MDDHHNSSDTEHSDHDPDVQEDDPRVEQSIIKDKADADKAKERVEHPRIGGPFNSIASSNRG